jgi:Helix-turn-helix family
VSVDPVRSDEMWRDLSRRAALQSHRMIGWIYWDPQAIENYAALGVPNGLGYYIATRGATLAAAGNDVVTAAFYSIHPDLVRMGLDLCRSATTFEAAAAARDAAVAAGLRQYVPEICDDLAAMAGDLWAAVDALPLAGRALFASTRAWPRPADDALLSAWLAVNSIREWRGDTHWAIHIAEDIGGTAAGILDGAWRGYEGDWLARSRGADDAALQAGFAELEARGLARDGTVNDAGVEYRQRLEDRLDDLASAAWRHLGEVRAREFVELVEPVGGRLLQRIDETAGPNWMPAARERMARR